MSRLEPEAQRELLGIARAALFRATGQAGSGDISSSQASPALERPAGAFVTLEKQGQLRGCIGTFDASSPLSETVASMAVAAATRDSRFERVEPEELADIEVSISVLTPMCEIASLDEIEVGRHGLVIERGARKGVLLPKVATSRGWDRDTFLAATCRKAALPTDAWKAFGDDERLVIRVFEAQDYTER